MEKPQMKRLQVDVNLKDTAPVICDKCQNESFQDAIMLRKVSALLTGTGKEGFLPIQAFACMKCGHVNNQFLPEELRSGLSLATS